MIFVRLSVRGISSENPSICLLLLTVDAQQTKSKQKVGKIKKKLWMKISDNMPSQQSRVQYYCYLIEAMLVLLRIYHKAICRRNKQKYYGYLIDTNLKVLKMIFACLMCSKAHDSFSFIFYSFNKKPTNLTRNIFELN